MENYTLNEICIIDVTASQRILEDKIASSMRKYVDAESALISQSHIKVRGMHSDFILSNIIIDENKVTVLDLSGFSQGPSCRDVANFLYSLDCYLVNPIYRPSIIDILKKEFLFGYGWDEQKENMPLFRLFKIREILGGLLQLSRRVYSKQFGRLIFKRVQEQSRKSLLNILNLSRGF